MMKGRRLITTILIFSLLMTTLPRVYAEAIPKVCFREEALAPDSLLEEDDGVDDFRELLTKDDVEDLSSVKGQYRRLRDYVAEFEKAKKKRPEWWQFSVLWRIRMVISWFLLLAFLGVVADLPAINVSNRSVFILTFLVFALSWLIIFLFYIVPDFYKVQGEIRDKRDMSFSEGRVKDKLQWLVNHMLELFLPRESEGERGSVNNAAKLVSELVADVVQFRGKKLREIRPSADAVVWLYYLAESADFIGSKNIWLLISARRHARALRERADELLIELCPNMDPEVMRRLFRKMRRDKRFVPDERIQIMVKVMMKEMDGEYSEMQGLIDWFSVFILGRIAELANECMKEDPDLSRLVNKFCKLSKEEQREVMNTIPAETLGTERAFLGLRFLLRLLVADDVSSREMARGRLRRVAGMPDDEREGGEDDKVKQMQVGLKHNMLDERGLAVRSRQFEGVSSSCEMKFEDEKFVFSGGNDWRQNLRRVMDFRYGEERRFRLGEAELSQVLVITNNILERRYRQLSPALQERLRGKGTVKLWFVDHGPAMAGDELENGRVYVVLRAMRVILREMAERLAAMPEEEVAEVIVRMLGAHLGIALSHELIGHELGVHDHSILTPQDAGLFVSELGGVIEDIDVMRAMTAVYKDFCEADCPFLAAVRLERIYRKCLRMLVTAEKMERSLRSWIDGRLAEVDWYHNPAVVAEAVGAIAVLFGVVGDDLDKIRREDRELYWAFMNRKDYEYQRAELVYAIYEIMHWGVEYLGAVVVERDNGEFRDFMAAGHYVMTSYYPYVCIEGNETDVEIDDDKINLCTFLRCLKHLNETIRGDLTSVDGIEGHDVAEGMEQVADGFGDEEKVVGGLKVVPFRLRGDLEGEGRCLWREREWTVAELVHELRRLQGNLGYTRCLGAEGVCDVVCRDNVGMVVPARLIKTIGFYLTLQENLFVAKIVKDVFKRRMEVFGGEREGQVSRLDVTLKVLFVPESQAVAGGSLQAGVAFVNMPAVRGLVTDAVSGFKGTDEDSACFMQVLLGVHLGVYLSHVLLGELTGVDEVQDARLFAEMLDRVIRHHLGIEWYLNNIQAVRRSLLRSMDTTPLLWLINAELGHKKNVFVDVNQEKFALLRDSSVYQRLLRVLAMAELYLDKINVFLLPGGEDRKKVVRKAVRLLVKLMGIECGNDDEIGVVLSKIRRALAEMKSLRDNNMDMEIGVVADKVVDKLELLFRRLRALAGAMPDDFESCRRSFNDVITGQDWDWGNDLFRDIVSAGYELEVVRDALREDVVAERKILELIEEVVYRYEWRVDTLRLRADLYRLLRQVAGGERPDIASREDLVRIVLEITGDEEEINWFFGENWIDDMWELCRSI